MARGFRGYFVQNGRKGFIGAALALGRHAFEIAARRHFHAHDFIPGNKERHANLQAVVEGGFLPGVVLLRVHRRRGVRHAGLDDGREDNADGPAVEELHRKLHLRLQESFAGPRIARGISTWSKVSGFMNVQLSASLYRNSIVCRSNSNSSRRSSARKCGSQIRPVSALRSLVLTTPHACPAPVLNSASRTL